MKALIQYLASMKLAVALLVALLVAMAAGTIVESTQSTSIACQTVYYASWFQFLEAALGLNVLAALVVHWPWGASRTGFAITHGSLLIILTGAAITQFCKVEGQLQIWEGEKSNQFAREGNDANAAVTLPFSLTLQKFEIDMYPGTQKHAMYRSRVVVEDAVHGTNFPAVIEMNRELVYQGWKFFQSSYQLASDRNATVLSVSRDPGQPVVFVGYILLLIGMVTVLGTRIGQALEAAKTPARPGAIPLQKTAVILAWLSLAMAGQQLQAAPLPDPATSEALKRLPIQHDGRVMPLDTVAREAVWNVTGSCCWQGIDCTQLVLGWVSSPEWANEPVVKIGNADLTREAGLAAGTTHASFNELVQNPKIMALIKQATENENQNKRPSKLETAASQLESRLVWMDSFFRSSIFTVIPHPTDPKGTWSSLPAVSSLADLKAVLDHPANAPSYPTAAAIDRELSYNQLRPTRIAWEIMAVASLLSLLAMWVQKRWLDWVALLGLAAGWGVMSWGYGLRWQVGNRVPAADMYESMLALGLMVSVLALVLAAVFAFRIRIRLVAFCATAIAGGVLALIDLLPMDSFIHTVKPVLANTPWLAIHVPIIMMSYAALAISVIFAHIQIIISMTAPKRQDLVELMNSILYWFIHAGSILLIAGIITGSMWGASSWGRYWGWDPKEVWSLVAFFAYVAILHARIKSYISSFAVAAISIGAFMTILMTYLGVNFVLATGLHSYGFGGSSIVNWMVFVAVVEIVFVLAGWTVHRKQQRNAPTVS